MLVSMSFKIPIIRLPYSIRRVFPASHYSLLALLFFVGLELISAFHQSISILAIVLLALVSYGIVLVRYEEKSDFRLLQSILPILAAFGLTGFSLFLPITLLIHIYHALAGLILFWLLKHAAKQAYPTWNWTLSLLVLFLNISVLLGLRFYLFTNLLLVLCLVFAIIFLISLQALSRVIPRTALLLLIALALVFVLTQIISVMQLLPHHFLV